MLEEVMGAVRIQELGGELPRRPAALAGDKGYSYPRIRQWLRHHGIRAVIPFRQDEIHKAKSGYTPVFDRETYRRRSVIECCISWLKECRRVATRFEKLARNFLAVIKVAIIQRYLRKEFSDRP